MEAKTRGSNMGEKKAYEQWRLAKIIYGDGSKEAADARALWKRAAIRNANSRARHEIIADMCGTSYAAAKRDIGL